MLELIESKLIMILLTQTLISVVSYVASYFIALFSLFTVTFLRNSENSSSKHVESFSQIKANQRHNTLERSWNLELGNPRTSGNPLFWLPALFVCNLT